MNVYLYLGIAVVAVGLLLVSIGVLSAKSRHQTAEAKQEAAAESIQEEPGSEEISEPEKEEIPAAVKVQIHELFTRYYDAYTSGDTDALAAYAVPVSELEKSYIKLMSRYTESTKHIQCRIKKGLQDGEYAVSVVADMKLAGIPVAAPGLDFFYVRTGEDGVHYIDNAYSSFNASVHVLDRNSEVEAWIADYEAEEGFQALQKQVQDEYDKILESHEELKDMLLTKIPQAVNEWLNTLASGDTGPKDTNDIVPGAVLTVKNDCSIRKGMNADAKKLGTAKKGDELKILGNDADGWTKVKWNGETGYAKTGQLIEKE